MSTHKPGAAGSREPGWCWEHKEHLMQSKQSGSCALALSFVAAAVRDKQRVTWSVPTKFPGRADSGSPAGYGPAIRRPGDQTAQRTSAPALWPWRDWSARRRLNLRRHLEPRPPVIRRRATADALDCDSAAPSWASWHASDSGAPELWRCWGSRWAPQGRALASLLLLLLLWPVDPAGLVTTR